MSILNRKVGSSIQIKGRVDRGFFTPCPKLNFSGSQNLAAISGSLSNFAQPILVRVLFLGKYL
ncbi:hypothetical protein DLM76_07145 [Leptospira yasudae]|nr:hypothetical protein DLM76_07145 [Leptospira yasudae]